MNPKVRAGFLCLITPGILFAWILLILPFYIYDSITEDWLPNFKEDSNKLFTGIKDLWRQ